MASRKISRLAPSHSQLFIEELESRQLLSLYTVGVTDANATWHSINDVNNYASTTGFAPGDQLLFESGRTFTGNLDLESPDQIRNMGTRDARITICSYDPTDLADPSPAPATIDAGAGFGIKVYNAAGYHITNVIIQGGWSPAAAAGNAADGIVFDGNLGADIVLRYVHIDHVVVSGFGADYDYIEKNDGSGILFGNYSEPSCAYDDVAITDVVSHDNTLNGILLRAAKITNVLLDHDEVYDIYGLPGLNLGYGLHLRNMDRAVIQRCEVFDTGLWGGDPSSGGPVGIDVYYSSHVLVQYNDSHDNHDHVGGDGDGFALGEGTTYSILQYNFSHDNDGVGYLVASSALDGANAHNMVRYNVSENDCRYWNYGAIFLEDPATTDIDIYNNTVYVSPNAGHNDNILSAIEIPTAAQSVRVRNNVFLTSGGIPAVVIQDSAGNGLLFQGNDYDAQGWTPSEAQPFIFWGAARFVNVDGWRTATGGSQEDLNGMPVGSEQDPQLLNPGAGGGIDEPQAPNYVSDHIDQLGGLLAKDYAPGRPVSGVDLTQLGLPQWDAFQLQSQGGYLATYWVGPQDFSGRTFTWGGDCDAHSVGAFQ
jgi:hypothetical protein